MRTRNLADLYDLPQLEWASVASRLDRGFTQAPDTGGPNRHTCWLTTLDAGRRRRTPPASAPSGWTAPGGSRPGADTRKGRNLARDPRCTLAIALHEFDLVVEGTASVVTDPAAVARLAEHLGLRTAGPAGSTRAAPR